MTDDIYARKSVKAFDSIGAYLWYLKDVAARECPAAVCAPKRLPPRVSGAVAAYYARWTNAVIGLGGYGDLLPHGPYDATLDPPYAVPDMHDPLYFAKIVTTMFMRGTPINMSDTDATVRQVREWVSQKNKKFYVAQENT